MPSQFPSPFTDRPHPLAIQACMQLQQTLHQPSGWQHDFSTVTGGKMFGVLIVRDVNGRIGFLSAYSGKLAGQWELPGFVPPVFDATELQTFLPAGEAELEHCAARIQMLQEDPERALLRQQLDELERHRDAELECLRAVHKRRKTRRHKQRATMDEGLIDGVSLDRDRQLIRLSFESQQDRREQRRLSAEWVVRLNPVQQLLGTLNEQLYELKQWRARRSLQLQKKVFSTYRLINGRGEKKQLAAFFDGRQPPGGAGDCAAPKLFHYAHLHGLKPLAMAEFWWGAAPAASIRHHGAYYPACRGKCGPILPFLLAGIKLQAAPLWGGDCHDRAAPVSVYEDDDLLVVNKPDGLLSVPGKEVRDSVLTRLQQRYPEASGLLPVHRLDMATSGLLLVAKNRAIHKALQQQFLHRSIEKRYVAILSGPLITTAANDGLIELPLRGEIDDRPRQRVCFEHGKTAITRWEVIEREPGRTRLYFYPLTGRTHQLRVHAAHRDGLNNPIAGDALYGKAALRLLLHAERLCFTHPLTGKRIEVELPAPF